MNPSATPPATPSLPKPVAQTPVQSQPSAPASASAPKPPSNNKFAKHSTFLNILIIGPSGSGKSACYENVYWPHTRVINVERKEPPFVVPPEYENCMYYVSSYAEFLEALTEIEKDPSVRILIIDSFTHLQKFILEYAITVTLADPNKYARYNKTGQEIFKNLERLKSSKFVSIVISLDDTVTAQSMSNDTVVQARRAVVEGKMWEGQVESQFTVVLFTQVTVVPGGGGNKHEFILHTNGTNSAKLPKYILPGKQTIPNDINLILKAYDKTLVPHLP